MTRHDAGPLRERAQRQCGIKHVERGPLDAPDRRAPLCLQLAERDSRTTRVRSVHEHVEEETLVLCPVRTFKLRALYIERQARPR